VYSQKGTHQESTEGIGPPK